MGSINRGDARARDEHRTRSTSDKTSRQAPAMEPTLAASSAEARSCLGKNHLRSLVHMRRKGARRPPAHDGSS